MIRIPKIAATFAIALVIGAANPVVTQQSFAETQECGSATSKYYPESGAAHERLKVTVTNQCNHTIAVKVCILMNEDQWPRWGYSDFRLSPGSSKSYEAFLPLGTSSYDVYWQAGEKLIGGKCD